MSKRAAGDDEGGQREEEEEEEEEKVGAKAPRGAAVVQPHKDVMRMRYLLPSILQNLSREDGARVAAVSSLFQAARETNKATAVRKGLAWVDAFERDFARLQRDVEQLEADGFPAAGRPVPLFGVPPPPPRSGLPEPVQAPARLTPAEVVLFLSAPQSVYTVCPVEDFGVEHPGPAPRYTDPWARAIDVRPGDHDHEGMADVCEAWGLWAAFAHVASAGGLGFTPVQGLLEAAVETNGTPALARAVLLDSTFSAHETLGLTPAQSFNCLAVAAISHLCGWRIRRLQVYNAHAQEACRVLYDTLLLAKLEGVRLPRRDRVRKMLCRRPDRILPFIAPEMAAANWPPTEIAQVDFARVMQFLRTQFPQ